MTRGFYMAILALAGVGIVTCGLIQNLAAQEEPGRVRDAHEGFSFMPPPGWQRSSNLPNPQVRLVYLGPTQRSFRANVNLIVEKDSGEPFDDLATQAKGMYAKLFSAWEIAEEAPLEIDGKKAYFMSATYRMGMYTLRGAQFFVRGGNGKIYILTFTTVSDAFERLSPAMAQSAMSIRIE